MNNIKFYAVVQQFDPNSQNTFYKVETLKLIDIESNELNPIFFITISDNGLIYTIHPSEFGNQVFVNLSEAFSACDKKNNELGKAEYAMSHSKYEYATKDAETTRELVCGVDLVRSVAYWMTTVEYAKQHDARPSGFGGGHVYCSNCEKMSDEKTAYCPNCGRVMSNA